MKMKYQKLLLNVLLKFIKYQVLDYFKSVYEKVLAYELQKNGFKVEQQVSVPIKYENIIFEEGY